MPYLHGGPVWNQKGRVNFATLDKIKSYPVVNFIPDPRTIKIASGNSLIDYLQIKLWFELNVATKLIYNPMESKSNLNLQFIDIICHIIWKKYEYNEYKFYSKIRPQILEKHLFF